jgi:flagellar biosynthesis anti-sigma factor FlgM
MNVSGKVTGFDNRPVQVGGKSPTEHTTGKRDATARAAATPADHQVRLTDSAVQLAALEKALAQVPDVDLQRVAEIRASIDNGAYTVDSQRIATKLLELERSLAAAEADKRR